MPFNGSGSFSPPGANYPAVANTTADAADRNAIDADFATGLSNCITKDGQQTVTADIPLGDNKLTGVKLATASADAMTLANLQAQTGVYVGTVAGTADAITLSPSPAITAYAAGQRFSFIASGANTGATTVDVSAVGAKNVTKNGATALAANDILSAQLVTIEYDGTQFQVIGRVDSALYLKVADLLDEDDMASDSATQPASQQSIKAYVDPIVKTTGQDVNNSTTLTNDDDLTFSIAANDVWHVEYELLWNSANLDTCDIKFTWSVPSGATFFGFYNALGDTEQHLDTYTATEAINVTTDAVIVVRGSVVITNSTNAGTVTFQWAQNTASGILTLNVGSSIHKRRIA